MILLGVDTGGTFTDFVLWHAGELRVHKVASTPAAPDQAIYRGITELKLVDAVKAGEVLIIHGTTVATNATLEGKGAKTAFITNRGFADMLTLGRQARADIYQLRPDILVPPVPAELCLEVDTRRSADGELLEPLTDQMLSTLKNQIAQREVEAVAINLLFSYVNPAEEIAIANSLPKGLHVSRSSDVLPEYKEFERGIATWLNAYLGPLMQNYLSNLQQRLRPSRVTVMQSSGGTITAEMASNKAVNLLLSGPAGGLAAVKFLSNAANLGGLMTFDMGGTSTDVALVDGELTITNEGRIGPYPVAVPMVDMHTIGAGGGSIAYLDAGGLLQVGPQSAGADPGPACYNQGGSQPTVTDANVILGHLPTNNKLGGALQLNQRAAEHALEPLADQLNISLLDLAQGIIDIANEHMARALRVISVQRGHDPSDFQLCSFGGAGGLHVCDLAERLGMQRAVVPIHAGVLSALGLLVAPRERQLSRSVQQTLDALTEADVERIFASLAKEGSAQLLQEGVKAQQLQQQASIDLRYLGQSAHLNIPYKNLQQCADDFQRLHRKLYGHQLAMAVEVVNIRLRVYANSLPLQLPKISTAKTQAEIFDNAGPLPIYQRAHFNINTVLTGPALICETTATTLLKKGWYLTVDSVGNLLLRKT